MRSRNSASAPRSALCSDRVPAVVWERAWARARAGQFGTVVRMTASQPTICRPRAVEATCLALLSPGVWILPWLLGCSRGCPCESKKSLRLEAVASRSAGGRPSSSDLVLAGEERVARVQLGQDGTEAPHVDLAAVRQPQDHLGRPARVARAARRRRASRCGNRRVRGRGRVRSPARQAGPLVTCRSATGCRCRRARPRSTRSQSR